MLVPVRSIDPMQLPVTLEDAKEFCNIDHDDHDTQVEEMIAAATDLVDGYGRYLGIALLEQEWTFFHDHWPNCGKLYLPLGPVVDIIDVMYWDDADPMVQGTYPAANYSLLEDMGGPYLSFVSSPDFPTLGSRDDAVQIRFSAGKAEPEDVPAGIRMGIKQTVAFWYDNRASGADWSALPELARRTLFPYRRLGV